MVPVSRLHETEVFGPQGFLPAALGLRDSAPQNAPEDLVLAILELASRTPDPEDINALEFNLL